MVGGAAQAESTGAPELIGDEPVQRLTRDVHAALRRKPAHEARLAGAMRALAPHSASLRAVSETALAKLVKRGSHDRILYCALVRSLAELGGTRATPHLREALAREDAGGLATISAACFSRDPALAPELARVAASRHPQLAFSAEVARAARGESDGAHLVSVAPKIKEAHRIALCIEVLVPLLRAEPLPRGIAPALTILRGAERHLGRWLVLAEVASLAGDPQPLAEARERSADGPSSARAAWALVAWALHSDAPVPGVRPTIELVARLSDRPSADRDTAFLYRLAGARASIARPMLEVLAKARATDPDGVRAALHLARDYDRGDLARSLEDIAGSSRKEALRGTAAAALYDVGEGERSRSLTDDLVGSRHLTTVAWAALIRVACAGALEERLIDDARFRWLEQGRVE